MYIVYITHLHCVSAHMYIVYITHLHCVSAHMYIVYITQMYIVYITHMHMLHICICYTYAYVTHMYEIPVSLINRAPIFGCNMQCPKKKRPKKRGIPVSLKPGHKQRAPIFGCDTCSV